jgi:hypothetical protein
MPRSRGWTSRELDEAGVSISRAEHWLGRHGDPADLPESAWLEDRQPTREEERRGDDQ